MKGLEDSLKHAGEALKLSMDSLNTMIGKLPEKDRKNYVTLKGRIEKALREKNLTEALTVMNELSGR